MAYLSTNGNDFVNSLAALIRRFRTTRDRWPLSLRSGAPLFYGGVIFIFWIRILLWEGTWRNHVWLVRHEYQSHNFAYRCHCHHCCRSG